MLWDILFSADPLRDVLKNSALLKKEKIPSYTRTKWNREVAFFRLQELRVQSYRSSRVSILPTRAGSSVYKLSVNFNRIIFFLRNTFFLKYLFPNSEIMSKIQKCITIKISFLKATSPKTVLPKTITHLCVPKHTASQMPYIKMLSKIYHLEPKPPLVPPLNIFLDPLQ